MLLDTFTIQFDSSQGWPNYDPHPAHQIPRTFFVRCQFTSNYESFNYIQVLLQTLKGLFKTVNSCIYLADV